MLNDLADKDLAEPAHHGEDGGADRLLHRLVDKLVARSRR